MNIALITTKCCRINKDAIKGEEQFVYCPAAPRKYTLAASALLMAGWGWKLLRRAGVKLVVERRAANTLD